MPPNTPQYTGVVPGNPYRIFSSDSSNNIRGGLTYESSGINIDGIGALNRACTMPFELPQIPSNGPFLAQCLVSYPASVGPPPGYIYDYIAQIPGEEPIMVPWMVARIDGIHDCLPNPAYYNPNGVEEEQYLFWSAIRAHMQVGIFFPVVETPDYPMPNPGDRVTVTFSDARTFSGGRYEFSGDFIGPNGSQTRQSFPRRSPMGGNFREDGSVGPTEPFDPLSPVPSLTTCQNVVDARAEALTAPSRRGNPIARIDTIVLHQMDSSAGALREQDSRHPPGQTECARYDRSCLDRGERDAQGIRIKRGRGARGWRRWLKLSMQHYVTRDGSSGPEGGPKAYRIHDNTNKVWGTHGYSTRAIQVEIEGKLPRQPSDESDSEFPHRLGPGQARAARELCACIIAEVSQAGGRIKYIAAHRGAYGGKPGDPGYEVWRQIAIPIQQEFGLVEAPVIGSGRPIPEVWDSRRVGVPYTD